MFEVKITIEATELVQAINNLAAALSGARTAAQPAATPEAAPTGPAQTSAAPVTPTPVANPTAPGNSLSAMPQAAQTATVAPGSLSGVAYPASTTAPVGATVAPASMSAPAAPVTPAPAPVAPMPGVPVAAPEQYTAEQIMKAGAVLMDAGRVDELVSLLQSFGVKAVTELRPDQLGAFATALRSMGAKI